jgi:hypothetical protein
MCFVPRHNMREQLAENWDHHRYAISHYVVFPNTVFNCNPEARAGVQPDPVDRRPQQVLVLRADLSGRPVGPRVRRVLRTDDGALGAPEARRRRRHRDLRPLGTDQSGRVPIARTSCRSASARSLTTTRHGQDDQQADP